MAAKNTVTGAQTRQSLLDGAIAAVREHGIAGVSARTIAAAAGVNQALVFYHYGSVDKLLREACLQATGQQVELARPLFAEASSLQDLLAVGRELQNRQREQGHVVVLAQLLAGGQNSPELAEANRAALGLWIVELEPVLDRLLAPTPMAGLVDVRGLAHALAASFVGIGLYEGVDPAGAEAALLALEQLATVVAAVEELGPVAARVIRRRLRSRIERSARQAH